MFDDVELIVDQEQGINKYIKLAGMEYLNSSFQANTMWKGGGRGGIKAIDLAGHLFNLLHLFQKECQPLVKF